MNEFEFIDWVRKLSKDAEASCVKTGIGDDLAVIDVAGQKLLLGSDMLIEATHFTFAAATPEQVGRKALAVCLSDCAAMAGKPLAALVSISKPAATDTQIVKQIFSGISKLAKKYSCPIVGGDTCSGTEKLTIDISLLGICENTEPVLRSGAKPDDTIYVTGRLGGSILGKHLHFEPKIQQARWMAKNLPLTAMIDISDGLSSDLNHICEESKCGAELRSDWLDSVIAPEAEKIAKQDSYSPIEHALNDGEDFELLVTISSLPPEQLPELPQGITLLPVGKITSEADIKIIYPNGTGENLPPKGYNHFS